jgi:hypothetical protein
MNRAQKSIFKKWLWCAVALLVLAYFGVQAFDMGATFIPGLGLAIWFAVERSGSSGDRFGGGVSAQEFLQARPFLKLWMIIYCMAVLPFLVYEIYVSGGEAIGLSILCFILLVLPAPVVLEIERFRAAGKNV